MMFGVIVLLARGILGLIRQGSRAARFQAAAWAPMLMLGVDRNAQRMVAEIHRQFEEIPGLKEGKPGVLPEYEKCIDIAAKGALRALFVFT